MSTVDLGKDLAYRARALAQAHPLTSVAQRYLDAVVERQQACQPMPEIGTWAGIALLNGYCVRRVEEADAGLAPEAGPTPRTAEELEPFVAVAAAELRAGTAVRFLLGPEQRTIDALERIVGSEVERRLDHLRDEIDGEAWTELAEYLAWCVVTGYALRVAETDGLVTSP